MGRSGDGKRNILWGWPNEIKINNGKDVLIETVVSKTVYNELRNKIITPPCVHQLHNSILIPFLTITI